jgi:Zinc finger, C3HC4 type (RING finger)
MSQATDNDTFTTACEYNQTVPSQESQKTFSIVGKHMRSDENDDITEREGKDPIQELCQTTHSELTNLGKALTCPICCSTYQKAVLLPCVHAFCQACIVQALRFDAKCPLCKQPSRPRSLVECPVLDEMAVAYKQVMRALGWTPSMYTSVLEMTQLATSEPVPLLDCHDQLQASKAWQRVMEDSEDNKLLKEERRKVVQANERAVVQAAVQRQKTTSNKVVTFNSVSNDHQMEDERNRKSVEGKESSNDNEILIGSHVKDKSFKNKKKQTPQSPPETITFAVDAKEKALTTTSETFISKRNKTKLKIVSAVKGISSKAGKNVFNEIDISQCQDDSEYDLDEKKSPSSSQESTGLNALPAFDSVKHPVDRQDSPRDLNTDEESIQEAPEEIITRHENANITTADGLPPADDDEDDCDNISNGDDENPERTIDCDTPSHSVKANLEDDLTTQVIEVGTIVRVEPRTWPGINKQGGVARVTKVHMDSHAFDVAYILGGKEARVGAVHVTIDTSVSPTTSQQRARRGCGHENIPLSLLQALAREGFATTLGNSKDQTSQASGVLKREKENRPSSSTPKKCKVSKKEKDHKQHLKRKEHPQRLEIDGSKKACIFKALPTLPDLTDEIRDKLAFEHYLSVFDASINAGIINVVTTGLSEEVQMNLNQLVKLSKKQKGK